MISSDDLKVGNKLSVGHDGKDFMFRIDYIKEGEVYFVRFAGGAEYGTAGRMPVEKFVEQFNAGERRA